jgi:hypothetical protein
MHKVFKFEIKDALNHPLFFETKTTYKAGHVSFKEIIELKDEEGSKVTVFDRHRHNRSYTFFNGNP